MTTTLTPNPTIFSSGPCVSKICRLGPTLGPRPAEVASSTVKSHEKEHESFVFRVTHRTPCQRHNLDGRQVHINPDVGE